MKYKKYIKKMSGFSHVLIVSIVGVVLILGALGYAYYRNVSNKNMSIGTSTPDGKAKSLQNISDLQKKAIDAAKLYKSDGICFDAMTKATHTATGAKYTFSSSCLAPGWVADTAPTKSVAQLQKEAIDAAKAYKSSEICATIMTPATHTETGAKYTFSSSCLAPGWVADDEVEPTPAPTPVSKPAPSVPKPAPTPPKSIGDLQREAINAAKSYKPSGICFMAFTKATHTATGAKYTFPSSCLAPGWTADAAPAKTLAELQQEAIAAAKAYKPSGICAAVMTPATHVATGAKYTFSSCLAPGWVADAAPAKSLAELQQEAIAAARAYRSHDMCFAEMTPAIHGATGAKYTFSSSCIAPGWTRI